VTGLEIHWPGGAVEKLPAVEANQHLTIQEAKGIVSRVPLVKK